MKKMLFAAALALTSASMQAQTEVAPFQPGVTLDGVNYFLPRTALRVTVIAEKTVVAPGELNKYAFKYLRRNDVPTETSTRWTIKKVTLEPYGTADKDKAYNIKVKSKTIAPLVTLTHDGVLLSINTEAQEETLPAIPEGQKAPALLNPRNYMNQEILSAGSTAKMAELCAQEIYDIRESRSALIRGEADNTPKDGQQLKLMLDQLDEQAKALEQLFVGTTQTSTEVFSLNYIPTQETDKDILFRFSTALGVVEKDDLSGAPVYISIHNTGNLPARTEDPEADKKKAKMEKGIYVNVPAREAVTVFDAKNSYAKGEYEFGQFGYTEILSDILFNKSITTRVTLHQSNGAIKKLEQ